MCVCVCDFLQRQFRNAGIPRYTDVTCNHNLMFIGPASL